MTLPNISMFDSLFTKRPLGETYTSVLDKWRFDVGYRSPYMNKSESLVDIRLAIPEAWRLSDEFVLGVTGNIDGNPERQ